MNKIKTITILAALTLFSCTKKAPDIQTVNYSLKCDYCLITLEDNYFNASKQYAKNQKFVVNGQFNYSFVPQSLDSVTATIAVSVFGNRQMINFAITSGKNKATYNGYLGHNPDIFGESEFEKTIKLKIK